MAIEALIFDLGGVISCRWKSNVGCMKDAPISRLYAFDLADSSSKF